MTIRKRNQTNESERAEERAWLLALGASSGLRAQNRGSTPDKNNQGTGRAGQKSKNRAQDLNLILSQNGMAE